MNTSTIMTLVCILLSGCVSPLKLNIPNVAKSPVKADLEISDIVVNIGPVPPFTEHAVYLDDRCANIPKGPSDSSHIYNTENYGTDFPGAIRALLSFKDGRQTIECDITYFNWRRFAGYATAYEGNLSGSWKTTLMDAIRKAGVFSETSKNNAIISVDIKDITAEANDSKLAFPATYKIYTEYTIITIDRKILYKISLESAGQSSDFLGHDRVRAAVSGAAESNIKKFVEAISDMNKPLAFLWPRRGAEGANEACRKATARHKCE